MNKLSLALTFAAMMSLTTSAMAETRAVEININGIGPAVDGAAFETVKQVIGHAVADGIVDKFIVHGYGVEGGFSACAQASPWTRNFVSFVRQLKTIAPNPATTAYSVQIVGACTEEVTLCTQDVKQCPDGSSVGRVPPSCEFAPCPGN